LVAFVALVALASAAFAAGALVAALVVFWAKAASGAPMIMAAIARPANR
jgi:hypothetical protein